jgi:type I restriction enzyme S subunit
MADRIRTTVGALGELFDGPHATPVRRERGPYFLNISSLKSGRLDLTESDHVSAEDFTKWTRRVTPGENDLLFSYETRLGEAALMPAGVEACLGRRMALLRPDLNVVNARFLLYFYLSPSFQGTIQKHMIHGATVSRIGLATMPDWDVVIPQLPEQRAIAEVLGALDDKIAINAKTADLVDDLLATRFAQLSAGRSLVGLKTIAKLNQRSTKPHIRGMLRYLDISSVGRGTYDFPPQSNWEEAPGRARRLIARGDVVWSTVRPNRRSHALVLDADDSLVGSTGLAVLTPEPGRTAALYEAVRTDRFVAYLETVAEGSAYPAVRAERFLDAPVPDLGPEDSDRFEKLALPLRELVHAMIVESRRLAHTRDVLLPLLMSGKVRVKDAEKSVEGML